MTAGIVPAPSGGTQRAEEETMLGQWIDGLSEEERDRIVRANEWTYAAFIRSEHYAEITGMPAGKCLVAHVKDFEDEDYFTPQQVPSRITERYDSLCVRFGVEDVVRAIKLRAGASVEDLEPLPCAPTSSAGAHG